MRDMRRFAMVPVLGVGILLGMSISAQAQAPSPAPPQPTLDPAVLQQLTSGADASRFLRLPSVFVTAINVESISTDGAVQGTFTVENRDQNVQGGLQYQVEVLGPAPEVETGKLEADTAPQYDRVIDPLNLTLLPGSTKTVPFRYQAPLLPKGDYRLRIRVVTSQGRKLGWHDATVHLGVPNASFIVLRSNAILLPDKKTAGPQEGPNVEGGSTFTLQALAENVGSAAISVRPHREVYRWDISGQKVDEQTFDPVTVRSKETVVVEVPVTAGTVPDAYHAVLTLRDQEERRISGQAAFRFVVKGISAKVVTASFDRIATARGSQAVISTTLVGPADRETEANVTARVELLDGSRVVAEEARMLPLGAAATVINTTFTLSKDIAAPGFRVRLLSDRGDVLDQYEHNVNLSSEELQSVAHPPKRIPGIDSPVILGILLALVAVLAAFILWGIMRGRAPSRTRMLCIVLLLLASGLILRSRTAAANGIHVLQHPQPALIALFINEPRHNGTYGTALTVTFDLTFIACENAPTAAEVNLLYESNGVLSGLFPLPHSTLISSAHYDAPPGCPPGRHHCYFTINNITGPVSFGSFPHLQTTLQFVGHVWESTEARRTRRPPSGTDVWNLWIRFEPRSNASCVGSTSPTRVAVGEQFQAQVTMRNTGGVPWTSDGANPFRLGSENPRDNTRWVHSRAGLPRSPVNPGESVSFSLPLQAPFVAGSYPFDWAMLQEGIRWFGDICRRTITVTPPAPVLPDLTVENLNVSGVLVSGQTLTLSAAVRSSLAPAGASDAAFLIGEQRVGLRLTPPLPAGGTVGLTLPWIATPGSHRFAFCADAENRVAESREDNNCGAINFTVTSPTPPPFPGVPPPRFQEQP